MQASPTLTESSGHRGVPALAGVIQVIDSTKTAIWPTTAGILFMASPPWATREGVDAAAPTPSRQLKSAPPLVPGGALGSGGNPGAAGAVRVLGIRDGRDADQEEGAGARGRNVVDLPEERRATLPVDGHVARIEGNLGLIAGIADQRAGDRVHRAGSAAEALSVDDESTDLERGHAGREVHPRTALSDGPRKRSTVDVADRIVDVLRGIGREVVGSGDHPDDAPPAHDRGERWGRAQRREHAAQQGCHLDRLLVHD